MFVTGLVLMVACICLAGGLGHVATRPTSGGADEVKPTPQPKPPKCLTHECLEVAAWILSNMNQSADPCDDFFKYACSGWEEKTELPPGRLLHNIRTQTYNENRDRLETVLLQPITSSNTHGYERKLKNFYQSCVDGFGRDKKGAEHLIQLINTKLGGWNVIDTPSSNPDDWDSKAGIVSLFDEMNIKVFFNYYVYSSGSSSNYRYIRVSFCFLRIQVF